MKQEWSRFIKSVGYAWAGVQILLAREPNMRIHLVLAMAAVVLAAVLHLPPAHWAILFLTIGLVLAMEAINTAIETLTDLVSPEYHPQAKIVKDVAAGAVIITAVAAVLVAICLFLPPLWAVWR